MSVFPHNHMDVGVAAGRIRSLFLDRLDRACVILIGPDSGRRTNTPPEAVVFGVGHAPVAGSWPARIDGYFCAGLDQDRDRALLDRIEQGLRVEVFFRPDLPGSEDGTRLDLDRRMQPMHDPWTLLAEHPTLARFLMGSNVPSLALQVLAFASSMGFRRIYLNGFTLPKTSSHQRSLDMMFLRAVRACFNPQIHGLPRLDFWAAAPVPEAPQGEGRYAYATLVVGNYIFGAMALARSLARVSDVPLIVLHPEPEVAGKLAHLPNVIFRPVEAIANPNNHGRKALAPTYTKLRVFELLDYDRVVFIDADCLALRNPDGLFGTTGFCAAPNWGIGLGTKTFNSGVFAFSPSESLRSRVMANIKLLPSNTGGDQGYLNALFLNEWTCLPSEYNTLTRQIVLHPTLTSMSGVFVLHFTGQKPWFLDCAHREYEALVNIWLEFLEPEDWRILHWSYNRRIVRARRKETALRKVVQACSESATRPLGRQLLLWGKALARKWFRAMEKSRQSVLKLGRKRRW